MKYDFDHILERRGSGCLKWDTLETTFGSENILPMWVADMDFPVARPIREALEQRVKKEVYGYPCVWPELVDSVVTRMREKFGWQIDGEWVVFTPGVMPAINTAVKAFTAPGDEVIIQSPVYYPFWPAITNNGCRPVNNQLKLIAGKYQMDFDNLKQSFEPKVGMRPTPSRVRMMVLCSPHNPVGRVWSKEELTKLGETVIANDAIVISDEVHCELLFRGSKHVPFATISPEFAQSAIVCMAPSKTFNLAGLRASSTIIPDVKLRNRFNIASAGIMPLPNIFGLVALEAAYRYGDEWLAQLLDYLQKNLKFLTEYVETRIPRIKVIKPEGTYLVWLDCRDLKIDSMELRRFMREEARVGLDDGFVFGSGGEGFQRMNIACPLTILEEALGRIESAVRTL